MSKPGTVTARAAEFVSKSTSARKGESMAKPKGGRSAQGAGQMAAAHGLLKKTLKGPMGR